MDPISLNVLGVSDLVESKVNRVHRGISSSEEGPHGPQKDILELDLSDDELLLLSAQRSASYAGYEGKIKPKQDKNKSYYLGAQRANLQPYAYDDIPIAGNLLFEATETFLAAALAKNPDPVVWSDGSPEGTRLSDDTQTMLSFHVDQLNLRQKLTNQVRQWVWAYLGVKKWGWKPHNEEGDGDIHVEVRKIQNFLFDPSGYVNEEGDFVGWLGERIKVTARELIDLFPKHKQYITISVDGKLGTECTYTEWWEDDYTYATYMDIVLDKSKNPNWNWEEGARNHFASPKKPYNFLSVFSFKDQPHDNTGLIEQNIPNQNLINKEIMQLDYNISRNNNSTAFSENNFNQQTAKQATQAWIKGHNVLVPPGVPINEAIVNFPVTPIPPGFFENLQNNINNLRSIFGTQGITAQEPNDDTTARGMILNQQRDNTRIGGAISQAIEIVAKNDFNWMVQLYMKFYDTKHFAAVMGFAKGVEYVELSAANFDRQLVVTVAPDSMKPRDELTKLNQAQQLWQDQAIGLKTLLVMQKVDDVDAALDDALLWKAGLMPYLQQTAPELYQKLMMAQTGGMGQPNPSAEGQPAPAAAAPQGGEPPNTGGEPPNASLSNVPLPPV